MKECSRCKCFKEESEFNKRSDRPGKLKSACHLCVRIDQRIYQRNYKALNRERVLANRRKWRAKNRKKIRKQARDRNRKHPEVGRKYQFEHRERLNFLARKRHAANPERNRKKSRRFYKKTAKKNRAKVNKRQKERYKKNPETRLLRLYKITLEQFDEMILNQGGMCAICGKSCKLCVDHDHQTNKIRGLLCATCNQGIGLLGDSSEIASLASEYLKQHGK